MHGFLHKLVLSLNLAEIIRDREFSTIRYHAIEQGAAAISHATFVGFNAFHNKT